MLWATAGVFLTKKTGIEQTTMLHFVAFTLTFED